MRNKGGRCTVVGAKSDSIGSGRSNTLPLPLASFAFVAKLQTSNGFEVDIIEGKEF